MSRTPLAMLAGVLVCAAVFTLWPDLDLAASRAFFAEGAGFAGDRDALIQAMHKGVPLMSRAVIIGLLIALFAYSFQRCPTGRRRRLQVVYLITVLALGPGLVVDVLLKDHWGRARPTTVTEFGGRQAFTPALQPAAECERNCAFVSGHAAAGFYLAALGFLGGAASRRRWTLIALAAGGFMGFGRVAQGAHFASDVVFSFYAVWFSAWFVWVAFVRLGWMPDEEPDGIPATALAAGR